MEKKLGINGVSNENSVHVGRQFPLAGPKQGEKS